MPPRYNRGRSLDGTLIMDEKGEVNEFCSYTLPIHVALVVAIATCAVSSVTLVTELDTNDLVI